MEDAMSPGAETPDVVEEAYGPEVLRALDIVGREDFYGILAGRGIAFVADKMGLSQASHVLDLGSGIGGPARFFARTIGCRVNGIDLSAFNHRTAVERTRIAGLESLVTFAQGDALTQPVPDGAFTHVFGCEAWCYFADKAPLYARAKRALQPGGTITFVEAACEAPVRLRTEDLLGPVRYESEARYRDLLEQAGFSDIQCFDTTPLATQDVASSLLRLLAGRQEVVEAAGEDVYQGLLELWGEFLACFASGRLTHCAFVARAG
jgi:SAM-dependent methyltransferase